MQERSSATRLAIATSALLGANLWAQLLVASVFSDGVPAGIWIALTALPLLVLLIGITIRSELLLLLCFPLVTLFPLVMHGEWAVLTQFPPLRMASLCTSLILYLFAVVWVANYRGMSTHITTTKLKQHKAPARWQRRERIYWGLTAVTVIIPVYLFGYVLYNQSFLRRLIDLYGPRTNALLVVLCLATVLLWFAVVRYVALDTLYRHRTGDPDLVAELEFLGKRKRVRWGFLMIASLGLLTVAAIYMLR